MNANQPAWAGGLGKPGSTEKAGIPVTRAESTDERAQGERGERRSSQPQGFQNQGQPVFLSVVIVSLKEEAFHPKLQKLLEQCGRRKTNSQLPHPRCSYLQMQAAGGTSSFSKQLSAGTQNLNTCLMMLLEERGTHQCASFPVVLRISGKCLGSYVS